MRRARSIRAWLLGLCAALLLIVAGVQLLFGTSLARAYFLGQKKAEMETFFSYIRANYTDDTAVLFELLREGEDVQNIRVAIYDGDGRLLYTTRAMHEAFGALPRFPDGESGVTFSETPEAVELPARSDEDAQLSLAGTFSHQGETRYVLLWVLVASVESSLQAFSRVSLWIVAAVLAGAWPVTGDARALTAAVENLLSNAAAHTPPGGTVAVRLEAVGEQICLTVANQGDEIPEDRLPRLWERFYRADEARVRGGQVHVGLGLAIVRSVITRHGGTCRAENTGDGVAFAVTLPRRRE